MLDNTGKQVSVEAVVRRIITEETGETDFDKTTTYGQLGLDSLGVIELVMGIEEALSVEVSRENQDKIFNRRNSQVFELNERLTQG